MIVGERIVEISGNKSQSTNLSGLSINIDLEDVKSAGSNLEISYSYTVNYETGVGTLKIKGVLIAQEDAKLVKEVLDSWKATKKLPDEYAAMILTSVNYSGSANGTLVARVLGLTAPLIPPRIQMAKSSEGSAPAKGKK
jgi:hypothetical protein